MSTSATQSTKIRTVNLYGENGIAISLTADNDICQPSDFDAAVKVIGHAAYVGSLSDAERSIRSEYLRRQAAPCEYCQAISELTGTHNCPIHSAENTAVRS
jgi:hypothetical protein